MVPKGTVVPLPAVDMGLAHTEKTFLIVGPHLRLSSQRNLSGPTLHCSCGEKNNPTFLIMPKTKIQTN